MQKTIKIMNSTDYKTRTTIKLPAYWKGGGGKEVSKFKKLTVTLQVSQDMVSLHFLPTVLV